MGVWMNVKSVLQFSLHFFVYRKGIYLLVYSLKKIPTFLWVSKFDVKLECLDFNFKTLIRKCVFEKSC